MQIMKGNCEMDLNIYSNQFTDDIYPGRTPIYNPYGYVPLWRVWFSTRLV